MSFHEEYVNRSSHQRSHTTSIFHLSASRNTYCTSHILFIQGTKKEGGSHSTISQRLIRCRYVLVGPRDFSCKPAVRILAATSRDHLSYNICSFLMGLLGFCPLASRRGVRCKININTTDSMKWSTICWIMPWTHMGAPSGTRHYEFWTKLSISGR